ncbi:Aste57867_22889 [Aphanomyces stellatus]|uniref:Aste57867_22889 protein n=1 Tax=Aphanomyces stellatus TaxID=120398 RepID=A0A485LL59_9STRA|nr:hypothetical protein As57867_022818 [Aphanomyces stellatus]VFT99539.1 Aste57867_22889 [Aphanomyces stellatus]
MPTTLRSISLVTPDAASSDLAPRPVDFSRQTSELHSYFSFTLTCPKTQKHWSIQKRYAQFVALRQQLTRLHAFALTNCRLRTILKPFLDLPFPKKPLSTDSAADIAGRTAAFENMTMLLVAMRYACWMSTLTHEDEDDVLVDLTQVCDVLDGFLLRPKMQHDYTSLAEVLPVKETNPFQSWINGIGAKLTRIMQ